MQELFFSFLRQLLFRSQTSKLAASGNCLAEERRNAVTKETYEAIRTTLEYAFGILDIVIFRLGLLTLSAIGAYKLIRSK